MLTLPFSPTHFYLQRVVTLVLVGVLIALVIATAFASPVEAAKQCTGWSNDGCCDSSYWPGLQDLQKRQCRECWTGTCSPWWTEWRCVTFSLCG